MTKRTRLQAVPRPREGTRAVAMLAYPDAQILDVVGPLEVFSRTARWLRDHGRTGPDAYSVEIVGLTKGPFKTSSGLRLYAARGFREVRGGLDTLMIAGGIGTAAALEDAALLRWVRAQNGRVRRVASVCTGAFVLAEAGLLKGRRATTHWGYCDRLGDRYPDVQVEPDALFVREGAIATSAGVTAGMDLALALVEEDHGRDVALQVARELVMFLRRPGGQSQFSAQLQVQMAGKEPIRELQAYILEHPEADLSVPALAARVAMSPRNFARVFTREVGTTPARFIVNARVETARRLLEDGPADLKAVCARSGLGSPEVMRRTFQRVLGIPPSRYRERFSARKTR
jgi:transcriptional regulator GlxA family with amidase domain